MASWQEPQRVSADRRIVAEVDSIAMDIKAATGHIRCDGWSWAGSPRVLQCGCGEVLHSG